jgi:hypothetical protein
MPRSALATSSSNDRTARAASRFACMKSAPRARSARYWLWARHTSRTFSAVDAPPRQRSSSWSYSRKPIAVHRTPLLAGQNH